MNPSPSEIIKEAVRQRYGAIAAGPAAANDAATGAGASCCGGADSSACAGGGGGGCSADQQARTLGYAQGELDAVPDGANLGLGCGNPLAILSLQPGQTVLDLGSGAGFDAFLAARAVGPTGKVIGVDMTAAMVAKARANAQKGGYPQVEFRQGEIEALPVADGVVDVIISNCVINLCPDKRPVYQEAFRVLKPGGRIAVSDVVAWRELAEDVQQNLALHCGCLAGATPRDALLAILADAGFVDVVVRPKGNSEAIIGSWDSASGLAQQVFAAEVLATKPTSCCQGGLSCCA